MEYMYRDCIIKGTPRILKVIVELLISTIDQLLCLKLNFPMRFSQPYFPPFQVEKGGFQWPILVAGIVSGLVFFVVGIIVSMMCKKSAKEKVSFPLIAMIVQFNSSPGFLFIWAVIGPCEFCQVTMAKLIYLFTL